MYRHLMLRAWIVVCGLTICGSPAINGQILIWKPGQSEFPVGLNADAVPGAGGAAGTKVDDGPTTILLHPMPEPIPALKYRFWVTAALRDGGSVMPHITRAQLLYFDRSNLSQLRKEYAARAEAWHNGPLDKMPEEEVRKYLAAFQPTLNELHRASNLERIEYDLRLQDLRGSEVFNFLLPEVQHYRELGRLLSLEARLAIAEGHFDDAMRALQAGFRLSEVVSASGGTLIVGRLVSIAITGMMLGLVEEMIQQPGAPNMYWALVSLPDSLWSNREALEGEFTNIQRLFLPTLRDLEPGASPLTWNEQLLLSLTTFGKMGGAPFSMDDRLPRLVAGLLLVAAGDRSRQQLLHVGVEQSVVDAMPSSQATMLAFSRNIDVVLSDIFKSALLPASVADRYIDLAEQKLARRVSEEFADPAIICISLVLPAIQATLNASRRIESERNRLAAFEAIRAYAAVHDNKLPASLTDLIPVPALFNAFTHQPFEYRRLSDTEAIFHKSPLYPGDKKTEMRLRLIVR